MLRIGDDGIDISWMRTALSVYRSVFTFFFSFFFYVLKNFRPKLSCLFVFFFFSFFLSFWFGIFPPESYQAKCFSGGFLGRGQDKCQNKVI